MEKTKVMIYEDQDFESYKSENVGVIKIKNNVFEIITDLPESSKFIKSINSIEKDINIDSLVIINENNCLGTNAYADYLKNVFSHDQVDEKWHHLELSNRETRTRELVILNNLLRKIVQSNKLVVSALYGEIATPFFGASLAADLRLASEDVIFSLSHSSLGVHPSGALPYFLPKYIGHAKASRILYSSDKITLSEALELDIIYEILPIENFEELSIIKVKQLLAKGNNVMKCTKKLLTINFEDIDKYLNLEECNYLRR